MSSSTNKYDPIELLIFEKGLKIKGVHFYEEMDMMVVVLNNKKVITRHISASTRLAVASKSELHDYELPGRGAAIHWPSIDEDLSLKGLLQEELVRAGSTFAD